MRKNFVCEKSNWQIAIGEWKNTKFQIFADARARSQKLEASSSPC